MQNGSATLIGPMGNPSLMISCDCDAYGNMYATELSFSGSPLYLIDTITGSATLIGNLGISGPICIAYDKDANILYTFPSVPVFTIPYSWPPNMLPLAEFSWEPKIPSPEKTIFFNASDSYDPDGNMMGI